jgi:adenylate cyclase
VLYQGLKVGEVHLCLTKKEIEASIVRAKVFILMMTLAITLTGIVMSMVLSFYFSRPIQRLVVAVEEIGKGNFAYRVNLARNDELGDLGEAINRMAEDLRLKERIQTSFGRYVTPEIVERILASPDDEWMKGTRLEATIMFVDIRGFTALAERSDPDAVVELLNSYFRLVTDIIIKHGGYLDKFVGDAVMGVFGALIPDPVHAESAVRAAVEVRHHLPELNQRLPAIGGHIRVGIGINTGEVVAGNLGSSKRMEYTVIGDNVNVASRLTDLAGPDEVLISEHTFNKLAKDESFILQSKGSLEVKGRKEPVRIYEVLEQSEREEQTAGEQ